MHYMKDLFQKKTTEHAHSKFIRYSKGTFVGPLLKVKFGPKAIKFAGSFHFVDELLSLVAEVLEDKEVHIKGTLVWNEDLRAEFEKLGIMYSKVTKARGIFKYALDNNVKMKEFVETLGKYNMLINVKTDDVSLVTKTSFPKPNKEFTRDFCKATFPMEMEKRIKEEFLFDVKEDKVKEAIVSHSIVVENINLPTDVSDFEIARRLATREGDITRTISVNKGEEVETKVSYNI